VQGHVHELYLSCQIPSVQDLGLMNNKGSGNLRVKLMIQKLPDQKKTKNKRGVHIHTV
jgi:hypothetical protein